MRNVCLICGKTIKAKDLISHLQHHRLSIEDFNTGLFYAKGRYLNLVEKFPISQSTICPNCNSYPSPIIYKTFNPELIRHFKGEVDLVKPFTPDKDNMIMLVKCSKCNTFYLIRRGYKKNDRTSLSKLQEETRKDN